VTTSDSGCRAAVAKASPEFCEQEEEKYGMCVSTMVVARVAVDCTSHPQKWLAAPMCVAGNACMVGYELVARGAIW
jgi:hypothetical protein